ncbi:MAG: hypothetical protein WC755_02625, partial [Candidatus Woesearchaeota archaeon]
MIKKTISKLMPLMLMGMMYFSPIKVHANKADDFESSAISNGISSSAVIKNDTLNISYSGADTNVVVPVLLDALSDTKLRYNVVVDTSYRPDVEQKVIKMPYFLYRVYDGTNALQIIRDAQGLTTGIENKLV